MIWLVTHAFILNWLTFYPLTTYLRKNCSGFFTGSIAKLCLTKMAKTENAKAQLKKRKNSTIKLKHYTTKICMFNLEEKTNIQRKYGKTRQSEDAKSQFEFAKTQFWYVKVNKSTCVDCWLCNAPPKKTCDVNVMLQKPQVNERDVCALSKHQHNLVNQSKCIILHGYKLLFLQE